MFSKPPFIFHFPRKQWSCQSKTEDSQGALYSQGKEPCANVPSGLTADLDRNQAQLALGQDHEQLHFAMRILPRVISPVRNDSEQYETMGFS